MVLVTLSTPDQLYRLMIAPNLWLGTSYSLSDDYELASDIDMSGFSQPAESIGLTDLGNGFQGNFDGKGKTITIGAVSSTYCGLFYFNQGGTISNLTVVYKNDGITITDSGNTGGGQLSGGFIALAGGNVTNCNIILPNSVTIGLTTSNTAGGFIGAAAQNIISNCSLIAGNNLTINSSISSNIAYSGGFIGYCNGGEINSCTISIGNNLTINGYSVGGITGFPYIMNNVSLIVGDNCNINTNLGINGYGGGISGDGSFQSVPIVSIDNIKAIYGNNTTIRGGNIGGIAGRYSLTHNMSNTIVLYKNNTYLNGNLRGGGILTTQTADLNVFALYNDYSIKGTNASGPIYAITPPIPVPSVLANTCGSPLPGSNVTNMSTTSLDSIIAYLETIPYLADLIPYIRATYCFVAPIPVIEPPCACTAYLCNSNPQTTNYDESEDKSRMADQMVHSNVDVKLAEMWAGTRVQSVPIFKSYDEMMMWKQGALKYRR